MSACELHRDQEISIYCADTNRMVYGPIHKLYERFQNKLIGVVYAGKIYPAKIIRIPVWKEFYNVNNILRCTGNLSVLVDGKKKRVSDLKVGDSIDVNTINYSHLYIESWTYPTTIVQKCEIIGCFNDFTYGFEFIDTPNRRVILTNGIIIEID